MLKTGISRRRFLCPGIITSLIVSVLVILMSAPHLWAQDTGKQDYMKYCAGCHGSDGKGNGPDLYVLPGIKPPDLTLLSKENAGVFPTDKVEATIDGRKLIPSHKRFDMPFWGVNLQEKGKEFTPESEAKVKKRIADIARYIETIQQH